MGYFLLDVQWTGGSMVFSCQFHGLERQRRFTYSLALGGLVERLVQPGLPPLCVISGFLHVVSLAV